MGRAVGSPGHSPEPCWGQISPCRLLLMGLCATACGLQPLDRTAATAAPVADPNAPPTTAILAGAPAIGLSLDDESTTTSDPCVKTNQDKTEILTVYCARCHSGPAEHAQGLPPWNFILDDARLISEKFTREQQPPQNYVVPGDPERSILYVRAAILGDMPPQPTDLGTPRNPTPTLSDFSVLHDWIAHCLPGSRPRGAPAPSPAADGGQADEGEADAVPADASPPDAGQPDARQADAGRTDAARTDGRRRRDGR